MSKDIAQPINVLYACDNKFAEVLGVSLHSLYRNNSGVNIRCFIIGQGLDAISIERFNTIARNHSRLIEFINNPDLDKIIGKRIDIQRYSISIFSRMLIDTLLPSEIKRLIYLDCDTIITENITSLWNSDLNGKTLGAVDDMRNYRYCRNLGMKKDAHYINSGVLLIDLEKYREQKWQARMLRAVDIFNSYLEFPDNDIICKLMQDDLCLLDPRFNVISSMFAGTFDENTLMRKPSGYYPKDVFCAAIEQPAIIHYTTCFAFAGRPWMMGCTHPKAYLFLAYRNETPWKNVPLRPLKKSNTMLRNLYFSMPRWLSLRMILLLHSWLKPNMQFISRGRYKRIFQYSKESQDEWYSICN